MQIFEKSKSGYTGIGRKQETESCVTKFTVQALPGFPAELEFLAKKQPHLDPELEYWDQQQTIRWLVH